MRADVHMHCSFSNDSETRPEDMIESAIAKGLSVICFTDHYDKDNLDWGDEAIFDVESYFQKMAALQEEYRDRIDVRIGVELGMQPYLAEYYQKFTKEYPFDFVIGSVHSVQGHDVALDFFQKHSDPEGYDIYFGEMLQDVQRIEAYDVLGHLDYIVRYSNQGSKGFGLSDYIEIIEEILKQVIAHGKGIEMNMSGLKYGLGAPHPQPEILKRYRELGGEIITVGADGHIPEHIAYDYQLADDILKSCGFKYYTEFKGRKPVFVKI